MEPNKPARFPRAIEALKALQRAHQDDPSIQSEVTVAIQMIRGERPGIEAKYDALLQKLDRSYAQLLDDRAWFEKLAAESILHHKRLKFRISAAAYSRLINTLGWMRARNRDLIQAAQSAAARDNLTPAGEAS